MIPVELLAYQVSMVSAVNWHRYNPIDVLNVILG